MGRQKKPLPPGKKKKLSDSQRLVLTIPNPNYLYFKVLIPQYGRSESEVIIHLLNEFVERHRDELERNMCGKKLNKLETFLSNAEGERMDDIMNKYEVD